MLIRVFRSGYIIKIVIFLIVSVLLWLPAFLNPPDPVLTSAYGISYDFLMSGIGFAGSLHVMIAFILLLLQADIFNAVLVSNPLFSRSVFLPALIYVILMSHNPAYLTIHPLLVANFFLIFSLKNLYNTYDKKEAFREAFNASFWVAIASLFYWPALYMMLLIWMAFLIFRIGSWREWVISILGAGTPYLILSIVLYLLDDMDYMHEFYPDNLTWVWGQLSIKMVDYFFWISFFLLFIVAYFNFNIGRVEKIISIRKGFAVVNAFFMIAGITVFFSGPATHLHAYLMFPPAAVIIAFYFIESKKMLYAELLFLQLLVVLVIIKFL